MTPEELEAIEARLKWLAIYDSADDIPALTAALREAWARLEAAEAERDRLRAERDVAEHNRAALERFSSDGLSLNATLTAALDKAKAQPTPPEPPADLVEVVRRTLCESWDRSASDTWGNDPYAAAARDILAALSGRLLKPGHVQVPVETLVVRPVPPEEPYSLADLDLSPEGYVREWVKRGRRSTMPLPKWEQEYQKRGLITKAEGECGYLRIGTDVRCTITLTERGEALAATPSDTKERADG